MQMHTVLHSWAAPVQHWESALWSQVSSACLLYMLDRYTGFLWVGLQCDCFSRFSSLTDNIRHRNLLCRIPDINKYKTENPPQMHTNTKRQKNKKKKTTSAICLPKPLLPSEENKKLDFCHKWNIATFLSTQKGQTRKQVCTVEHMHKNICHPSEQRWKWAAHVLHKGFSGFTR